MKRPEELAHAHLTGLSAYVPGKQPESPGWIKLNTNELPFAPPPAVREAVIEEIERLARYPNPRSQALREALAAKFEWNPEGVIVGNGSDDVLNLLVRGFGGKSRRTADTFPSYSLYPVITAVAGGVINSVPFDETFRLPVERLLDTRADLLFLTCPNAPTGIRFALEDLKRLADGMEGLLVIDEAYAEFASASAISLLKEQDNVVITRTFSKAYGLAGLRVGFGLGPASVISVLDRIRDSYNVNRLSQAGALAALREGSLYDGFVREVREIRDWCREQLTGLGWKVYPSEANFLFGAPVSDRHPVPSPQAAASLFQWLESRKILVRYFPNHPLTASFLRISIGTKSEMESFLNEVRRWKTNALSV